MLYIDPEVCIDCGACEPACPVQAIFPQDLVPEQWKHYTEINADWYKKNLRFVSWITKLRTATNLDCTHVTAIRPKGNQGA